MKRLDEISIEEMERVCRLQILKTDLISVIKPEKRQEVLSKYSKFERREKRKNQNDYLNDGISRFLVEGEKNNKSERDIVTQFLIENEGAVDKGNVLLITLKKYLDSKDALNDRNHPLHNTYMKEKERIEEALGRTEVMAEDILRDEDIVVSRVIKNLEEKYYSVQVLMSKEIVDKIPLPGERKRERESKKVINALPNKALLIAVLIGNESMADKDIYKVPNLGRNILDTTLENAVVEEIITPGLIEKFQNSLKEYSTNYITNEIQPVVKKSFAGIEKYIDMDKMCLTACVEIIKASESGQFIFTDGEWEENKKAHEKDAYLGAEEYLSDYYAAIKDKEVEVVFNGQTFTTEDIKRVMVNYIDGRYMSRPFVTSLIELIMFGDKQVSDITEKQLERIREVLIEGNGNMIIEDLKRMIEKGLLDETTVLQLYENRKLSLNDIHEVKEMLHLEDKITPKFILQQLDELMTIDKKDDQYEKETIKRYIDLYKELYLEGKSEEELEKAGKALIEEIEKEQQKDEEKTEEQKQEGILQNKLLSEKTYAVLASKGVVKPENLMHMYQKDVVQLETLQQLKQENVSFDNLDIEQQIIDSYMKIREEKNPDDQKLKKYITLYKTLQLKGLSENDRAEGADEFIVKLGDRIETDIQEGKQTREFGAEDRRQLYELGAIPIDTVVLWGEKEEIIDLLKSKTLLPKDIKKLYQDRRIILHDFQEIMEAPDIEVGQKLHLVNTVFSSHEVAEIRQDLMARIKGLKNTASSEKTKGKQKSADKKEENTNKSNDRNRYIFDTAERYNAWIESDEDVRMSLFDDGHVAFQLPSVKDGIVVIEELWKTKTVEEDGIKEKQLIDKYGANGYVLTIEEYEKYKDRFITTDNRIKRSKLIELVQELPSLEEEGILRELLHTKNKYTRDVQTLLGIPKSLAGARTDTQKEKALKTLDESTEYTPKEKERIRKIHTMWEQVRESRDYYKEQ